MPPDPPTIPDSPTIPDQPIAPGRRTTPAVGFVLVLSGVMAAGKSTVGQVLAESFGRSVHLRGDVFRRMVVGGRAEPDPKALADPDSDAARQLRLRYRAAADAAVLHARAGFGVIWQDVILGPALAEVVDLLPEDVDRHLVVLAPRPDVVADRERSRAETGYGSWTVEQLDADFRATTPPIGLWLDTSELTVDATVRAVLERWPESVVGTTRTDRPPATGPSPEVNGLLDELTEVLRADDRVVGLWLTGSLATGDADPYSDVDVLVAVRGAELAAAVAAWPATADRIATMVHLDLRPPEPGGGVLALHVTDRWVRLDVRLIPDGGLDDALTSTSTLEVFRRTAVPSVRAVPADESGTERSAAPATPNRDEVLALVREFLRVLGLHPVALGRGEVVTARSGVGLLQEILVSLLRHEAEAGARSGALHLSRVLPAGTMADLRRLPPVSADRRSCIDGALAVTELAMPVALRLLGEEFPEPMAHACAAYWQRELGVVPVGLRSPGGSPSTD